jgi:hypothetical protein
MVLKEHNSYTTVGNLVYTKKTIAALNIFSLMIGTDDVHLAKVYPMVMIICLSRCLRRLKEFRKMGSHMKTFDVVVGEDWTINQRFLSNNWK